MLAYNQLMQLTKKLIYYGQTGIGQRLAVCCFLFFLPMLATCSSASSLRNSNRDFTRPRTHFQPQGVGERSL